MEDVGHIYVAFKCCLAAGITLNLCIDELISPARCKDGELNKQFPFDNDLKEIGKEREGRKA